MSQTITQIAKKLLSYSIIILMILMLPIESCQVSDAKEEPIAEALMPDTIPQPGTTALPDSTITEPIEEIDYGKKLLEGMASERIRLAEEIRNEFLDKGLDIKTKIIGKDKDVLQIEFALFNDVWYRKFQRYNSLAMAIPTFSKIMITDGYDYNRKMVFISNY